MGWPAQHWPDTVQDESSTSFFRKVSFSTHSLSLRIDQTPKDEVSLQSHKILVSSPECLFISLRTMTCMLVSVRTGQVVTSVTGRKYADLHQVLGSDAPFHNREILSKGSAIFKIFPWLVLESWTYFCFLCYSSGPPWAPLDSFYWSSHRQDWGLK